MNKLVVVIIGQDCQDTIGMCLDSVKDADKIIYLDGGSTDKTLQIVSTKSTMYDMFNQIGPFENRKEDINDKELKKQWNTEIEMLYNEFDKTNPNMISIQRNFYLDYLKKNHMGDICLVLDADEVVDDLKPFLKWRNKHSDFVVSPRMRHLMYNLGFEDASRDYHSVPERFFKITDDLYYPEGEHTTLHCRNNRGEEANCEGLIWHLGYLGGVWDVKKRYDQQMLRDSGHPKDFLKSWNKAHILGKYPVKQIYTDDLPDVILKNFGLSEEQVYFENRMDVEYKHFIFVKQWNEFFKPKSVADFGCGTGLYLYAWEMTGVNCEGYEISKYARDNKKCSCPINEIDLNEIAVLIKTGVDLVTGLDILEHLEYDRIDYAIDTLINTSKKYILTSIPYKGTPNCEADKTHIIKESEDWWRQKFLDKGLKEVEVPAHWIFKEQLLIFKK